MFESISTYNIDWEYIKGRYNTVADALSRLPAEPGRGEELGEEFDIPNVSINRVYISGGEEVYPSNVEDLAEKGISDDRYQELIRFVEGV